jgi:hypothetical protein
MAVTDSNNAIAAKNYLKQADNAIASMTGAASKASSGASSAVSAAGSAMGSARTTATKIGETATTMQGIAGGLLTNADNVEADANKVRGIADQNLANSQPWLQQSQALLGMDERAGGISGEFAKLYKQLDPALQMSLAAADARKESQSQTDSAVRSLQRAGVSPTAGALASIRQKAADQIAALVASVKTKARQSGITMQMDALSKGIEMAIAQSGVGQKFVNDATAGIVSAAQMEQVSGSLKTGAANIYGSSASLISDAQGLIQAAANGQVSANSLQISAANAVVGAFATAAEYYSTQASSFNALANKPDPNAGRLGIFTVDVNGVKKGDFGYSGGGWFD